jgi:hypothetical protein
MITVIRSFIAMPGKNAECIAIAKEVAAIYKRVAGRDIAVATALGGNPQEIAYVGQLESIGQMQEGLAKLAADAEFRATQKKVETVVVPGSFRDHLLSHL